MEAAAEKTDGRAEHRVRHLIVGGTGTLGAALTRQLLASGARVRVMTRTPDGAAARALREAGAGVEIVQGDLRDREALEQACSGVDGVVSAAHSLFGRGRTASPIVDGEGQRRLIDVARAAGVRHVAYTSVYDFGPALRVVPFFRIKFEVEEYLRQSGLSFTILRPTAFMESHAHLLIGQPLLEGRTVVVFGPGRQRRNFVAAADVARVAVRALSDPALRGATVDIGGPDDLSTLDVVDTYARLTDRRPRLRHLPLAVLRGAARLLRPVHPGVSQVVLAGVLAETHGQRYAGPSLAAQFGWQPTRLEDFAAQAVSSFAATRAS